MKLFEFTERFPEEQSCEAYWDSYNKCWHCSGGGHEPTLTAGTVMHNSKLSLMYWFKAIHLLTFGDRLFDRLIIASISSTSGFKHRIYNQGVSGGCG